MEAQAILTSLHFIGAELVAAVDLYKEQNIPQNIERIERQDIKVLLFIVFKIKLKLLISLNTRVCYKMKFKSSLGSFFSFHQ